MGISEAATTSDDKTNGSATTTTTSYVVRPPPIAASLLETIGNTPLVRVPDRALPEASRHATVLAKLELQNPGGSLKDRIALHMIREAEERGDLRPGMTIVDFTSGNTGIGYAMVAAALGYECVVVMPKVRSMLERYAICRQFGAEVHLVNPALGAPGAVAYLERLVAEHPAKYWWSNQLANADNPAVHGVTTGPEIWEQTGGAVDVFVHGIGTGGCVAGVGAYLKAKKPSVQVVALEPSESRVHTGAPPKSHGIVGWSPGIHATFLEGHGRPAAELSDAPRGVVDEWGHVATADAVQTATHVCRTMGLMCGPSSGAALKCAFDIAARDDSNGKTIVVVIPSHAIRYCAHPLWGATMKEANAALPAGDAPCTDKEQPVLLWDSAAYVEE
eukprot:CAMPEP_0185704402 /NCGR_PEP_ID=MMETSP1164-20130828/17003_1 /TAXON_ID=1104430 /ORGANISM="Chrysoreinhardia sp, Strain CCMP2950" /LENGTH=388 /DNA_ID=CAMNT_0028371753 /DNA_START=22 /DNA_END=1188 /DNA_ORIENTATION=-